MNMRMSRKAAVRLLAPLLGSCALCSAVAAADEIGGTIVFGRIVAGIDYQNNIAQPGGRTASEWRGAGNQWGTSFLGVTGSEELGPWLRAIFMIESGFSTVTGLTNGPALFNRRAYVGFDGKAGTLKLGKNLLLDGDVWFFDPAAQSFMSSATLVHGRNWGGIENLVEYVSPDFGGLQVTLQNGFGEQSNSFASRRRDGVELAYARGPLELRAIGTRIRDENGRYSSVLETSQEAMIGATWKVNGLKLFAAWEWLRAPDAPAGLPTSAHHYWIGANYDINKALTLIGAVFRIRQNAGAGGAALYMIGANYYLSKRTLLYLQVGQVRNSANASFSVEATNLSPLPGRRQSGGYLGAVYSF